MTATDELRRLLDERGVEHYDGTECTLWDYEQTSESTGCYLCSADEIRDGFVNVWIHHLTPAQAIDATLGSSNCTDGERTNGTCHFEQIPEALYDDIECSECGVALWGFQMDIAGEGCPTRPRYCPNCGRAVVE